VSEWCSPVSVLIAMSLVEGQARAGDIPAVISDREKIRRSEETSEGQVVCIGKDSTAPIDVEPGSSNEVAKQRRPVCNR
jgi:hypothetical protein